jgi:hypothetical protein
MILESLYVRTPTIEIPKIEWQLYGASGCSSYFCGLSVIEKCERIVNRF